MAAAVRGLEIVTPEVVDGISLECALATAWGSAAGVAERPGFVLG
jgi:hypothetical protein